MVPARGLPLLAGRLQPRPEHRQHRPHGAGNRLERLVAGSDDVADLDLGLTADLLRMRIPVFELARQLLRRREPNCLQPQGRSR